MSIIFSYVAAFIRGMFMALPLAVFVRAIASLRMRKLNLATSRAHELGAALLIMYCGGIAYVTVLGAPELPQRLDVAVNLMPLRFAYDVFAGCYAGKPAAAVINIIGNIIIFIPFGFLLSLLWRGASWRKALLGTAAFSLVIELLQLLLPDRMTDIDDLLLNSLGGLLGFLIYKLVKAGTAEPFRVTKIKTYSNLRE